MAEKTRKKLGILLADLDGHYNTQIWSEIRQAAEDLEIDIVVFEGRALNQPGVEGQHNIMFDMALKVPCDGYVIFTSLISNYASEEDLRAFFRRFAEQGLPTVSVSTVIPESVSVITDSRPGLKALIDHLLDEHGYRRLAFVKGPDTNLEAIERYKIFTDALEARSIPVIPELICSGDFSPLTGYMAAHYLHENNLLPVDCIVCANDEMAMGVFLYMREQMTNGNDIIDFYPVTGYDNTHNAQVSRPGLTTVTQPFARQIRSAFRLATDKENNQPGELFAYPTELVVRESCGCKAAYAAEYSDDLFFRSIRNFRVHQSLQTFSQAELFSKAAEIFPECGIKECYITAYEEPLIYPDNKTIPDRSKLLFAWRDGIDFTDNCDGEYFDTKDLLPAKCLEQTDTSNLLVKPIFSINEHIGYMVIKTRGSDTRNYEAIRGQLSNSMKIIALLQEQEEMTQQLAVALKALKKQNEKLNTLSQVDELTGIYNRRGFYDSALEILNDTLDRKALIIFADIDGMKQINDKYGHADGDISIKSTADILTSAVRDDDIVARLGGDEFVVMIADTDPSHEVCIRSRIQDLVKQFNESSNYEWKLSLSLGIVSFSSKSVNDLNELLKIADEALYSDKKLKKAK
ncbi:MAG: GGDEF domain-containing protein [Clostridiaceae bacterium]|nr:GGDEF domain-containing protein [Clostridiaceae bacterium]